MRIVDVINKKKNGEVLTSEEIKFFINGYVEGIIPDYQASALLMAILLKGMNKEETFYLTEAMLNSGKIVDLSMIKGVKVDKHSTGGVGDKTSLVLGPLVASAGVKLAKMSGRGLGHTGGTLDKLESIPSFDVNLSSEEFIKQVQNVGMAIIGQTADLVPADKKLYALRDVTGTVDSIPLIASSIMSKKLASGADTILLDVKFGEGAFMKTMEDAQKLAHLMVEIGRYFKKDTRAEITAMGEPLGNAIGNSLEVKEAVETLLGKGPKDLTELCLDSGATMLLQAKVVSTRDEGRKLLENNLYSGKAYKVFLEFVKAQHGDVSYIENLDKFPVALYQEKVKDFDEMTNLSLDLRKKLKENYTICNYEILRKQESKDGTIKYLFDVLDGNAIETVLMSYHHGYSICVSSQIGCKMGCKFCASTAINFSS